MARDGHDYDMGFHAPWCGKCGAEDDARQDAEQQFEDDQWTAMLATIAKLKAACEIKVPYGAPIAVAEKIEELTMELVDIAHQTFSWPDHTEYQP